MAKENVELFMKKVSADETLQRRMAEAEEKFAEAAKDRAEFLEKAVLPIAAEVGLPFTVQELAEVEEAQVPEGELDESELDNVAGGINFITGGNLKVICACAMYGNTPGGNPFSNNLRNIKW